MLTTDQMFTYGIISLIGIIFFFALLSELKLLVASKKLIKSLDKLASKLKETDTLKVTEQETIQQNWILDSLIVDIVDEQLVIKKTAGKYLSKTSLSQIVPSLNLSKNKSVPALLTSIGVAGTFLGITVGLSEFDMTNVGQDSSLLLSSAASLLEGMKTAFYTSLAGLALSALFMMLLQYTSKKLTKLSQDLNESLSKCIIEISPMTYLKNIPQQTNQDELIAAQLSSASSMNELSQQFKSIIDNFQGITDSLDGDIISTKVSSAVSKTLVEDVTPVLSSFKTELELLRQIKSDNQKELLESIITEIRVHLIEPVTKELAKTSQAVKDNNEVSLKLNSNVENVLSQMAGTVETIDKFQQETMQKLQDFAGSLQEILSSFKDETKGTMEAITDQVDVVLKESIKGMHSQREAFELSAEKASSSFVDMGNSLEQALEKRSLSEQKLFSDMHERVGSLLDETKASFEKQTDVLEATGSHASKLMTKAREELEKGLGDIDTKVTNMSSTVQSELENFRSQYQQNLTEFFTQQNNLLEDSLGKQQNNLIEVVDKFKHVFEEEYKTRHSLLQELTAQYNQLQESASTIEKLAKAIGLGESAKMVELQDAAHTIGKQVGLLKKEYVQASSVFREITEELPKAMDTYFKTANQSVETFFKGFDESSSKIHNRLSQAADFLVDAKLQERELSNEVLG